jgi:hypothetical protein
VKVVRAGVVGALVVVLALLGLAMSSVRTLAAEKAPVGGKAPAGAVKNEPVAGVQTAVSCLSASLCVLVGYNERSVGDVVAVRAGVPGHVSTVAQLSGIFSVSCPAKSGCVALGDQAGVGARFVDVNSTGVVSSTKLVAVPAGVTLTRIACTKLTACEVTGTDIFVTPEAIELGSWNGSSLKLHRVSSPKGISDAAVEGISCFGGGCDAVGYFDKGATVTGFVLTTTDGKPGRLQSVPGDSLYGVSCVSATRCYSAGYTETGGLVLTLNGGKASAPQHVKPDLMSIGCSGTSCTAAGEQLPPPSSPNAFWGALVDVSAGKVTSTQSVAPSGGFSGVARSGAFFAAVGASQKAQSELTTG